MAKKQKQVKKRTSKRQRKIKFFVYLMVIAMILSLFTAGLSGLALL
ncbi:MAG TPA: stressosome-associated protein Prli42 [Pseudogracilibacillus sp.]|nr:stressosome-associated protein Prli42 [Pseudogracilibacillus sp.]